MSYPTLHPSWVSLDKIERLYGLNTPIIGLTGGIATGKTSFAHLLKDRGVHVIDADQLIKKIYTRKDIIEFIEKNVPHTIEHGKINFRHLREHVFGHPDLKSQLEQFLYAHMPEAFINEVNLRPEATWVVYDVPLLFERSLNFRVDKSVVVYAKPGIQISRLMKRDNIDEDFAKRIISTQMSIEEKKEKADYVIDNSESVDAHPELFEKFWNELTKI